MFDLFVIGGGSGGISCARKASQLNQKVGLANFVQPSPHGIKWGLGGTCVNVGCIPKKLMHQSSLIGEQLHSLEGSGWEISQPKFKYENLVSKINSYIKSLNFGYQRDLIQNQITYKNSYASFIDENTILLKNQNDEEEIITAQNILIATGTRPKYLNIKNSQLCITSDDLFWMKKSPGKTLVIGSGYIGTETAGFLNGFNFETEILFRSKLLRNFDIGMTSKLVKFLKNKKNPIKLTHGEPISFEKNNDKILVKKRLKLKNGEQQIVEEEYDTVIQAIGREQDFSEMKISKINLKLGKNNKIPVNEFYQTNIPNIFAIGDIVENNLELTPVAIRQGEILAEGLFQNNWKKFNPNTVPSTVFSPLEYSFVGLTEEQSIENYKEENIEIYHTYFTPLEWQFSEHKENQCYTKIIVNNKNDEILGIHILSPSSGEIIQGFALAVQYKMKYQDLKEMIGIHPTMGEELYNIKFTKREN